MKKIIIFSFLLLCPLFLLQAAQKKEKAFVVSLFYDLGHANIQGVRIAERFVPVQQVENEMGDTKYWLELVSGEGIILEKRLFDFKLLISAEPPEEGSSLGTSGGTFELEQADEEVVFPFYEKGKLFVLYDLNHRPIDKKDISHLTSYCGDKKCQANESEQTCPKDCIIKKVDFEKSETISYEKVKQPLLSKNLVLVLSVILLLFVIGAGVFLLLMRKKQAAKPEYPEEYKERYDIDETKSE